MHNLLKYAVWIQSRLNLNILYSSQTEFQIRSIRMRPQSSINY